MWQGIVIGMIAMMVINWIINITVIKAGRKNDTDIRNLMIEGNRLRFERNKILDRIADKCKQY